jgi:hypothetical protein
MPHPACLIALLALSCLASLPAAEVELTLANGDSAYGELLSESETKVVIDRKVWTKTGVIAGKTEYLRPSIARMEAVVSLADFYAAKAKTTPDTYPAQFTLAQWCIDRGLQDQAFVHAKRLYDLDPKDEVSRKLLLDLGYVLDGAIWVKETEYAANHGLVAYDGKLMTPEQVTLRKAVLKADFDVDAATRSLKAAEAASAPADKRVSDAKDRLSKIKQELQQVKQAEAKAQRAQAKSNKQGNSASQGGAGVTSDYTDIIAQLEKSAASAQKTVDAAIKSQQDAKKEAGEAKVALAKATTAADVAHKAWDAAKSIAAPASATAATAH